MSAESVEVMAYLPVIATATATSLTPLASVAVLEADANGNSAAMMLKPRVVRMMMLSFDSSATEDDGSCDYC